MKLPGLIGKTLGIIGLLANTAFASTDRIITVASTTSTEQSGLFAHILPVFEKESGIKVRVVALGTGQALDTARRGDADVAFVHDKAAEEKFVAEGHGVKRYEVMYNDFILLGPRNDPAKVAGKDIAEGLRRIAGMDAARRPAFVSRGDKSGTHTKEVSLWPESLGITTDPASVAAYSEWYLSSNAGMGVCLTMANEMDGYILSDKATFLAFLASGGAVG